MHKLKLLIDGIPVFLKLFDDFRMLFFRKRNLFLVKDRSENDEHDWNREHDHLEVHEIGRRNACSRSLAGHANPYRSKTNDTACDRTGKLINQRSYAKHKRLITMTKLELAIFYRIRDRHKNNQEDERLRQSEETGSSQGHTNTLASKSIQNKRSDHDDNGVDEQLTTAELLRECREKRYRHKADDDVDDTQEGKL